MKFKSLLIITYALLTINIYGEKATEDIVSKAREYLGGDEVLLNIKTIYYEGEFENVLSGDGGTMKIWLEKPLKYRMVSETQNIKQIIVVNDYDGWSQTFDKKTKTKSLAFVFSGKDLKRTRATVWENLNFFTNLDMLRGTVIYQGEVKIENQDAVLIKFDYGDDIYFKRYFNKQTGRLMQTASDLGIMLKEIGEQKINGILFPTSIFTYKDDKVINSMTFKDIRINEQFDEELFTEPK